MSQLNSLPDYLPLFNQKTVDHKLKLMSELAITSNFFCYTTYEAAVMTTLFGGDRV
jgi:hypothetical protein